MLIVIAVTRRWRAVMDDMSLLRRNLDMRLCIWIFNGIDHSIKVMRFNDDLARSNLGHRFLGRILPFDLFSLRLLRLRPVSFENTVTEPLLLGAFQGYQ